MDRFVPAMGGFVWGGARIRLVVATNAQAYAMDAPVFLFLIRCRPYLSDCSRETKVTILLQEVTILAYLCAELIYIYKTP